MAFYDHKFGCKYILHLVIEVISDILMLTLAIRINLA